MGKRILRRASAAMAGKSADEKQIIAGQHPKMELPSSRSEEILGLFKKLQQSQNKQVNEDAQDTLKLEAISSRASLKNFKAWSSDRLRRCFSRSRR